VQWHPENFFRTGEFRSLFDGFVDEARKKVRT
jgi:gamma-glutamyl-gamma-aminobutyrate hydrolase PuuD